jgi:hypothetical protein
MKIRPAAYTAIAACCLAACNLIIGLRGEPTLDASIGDAQPGSDTGSDASAEADACATCMPVAIASGLPGPFLLAQYGTELYWTDLVTSTVETASKSQVDGSAGLFAVAAGNYFGIAADDSGVYFTDLSPGGAVYGCPLPGCPSSISQFTLYAIGGMTNTDIQVNGGWLYWLQADGDEIDRMLEADANAVPQKVATTATTSTTGLAYLSRIATDGTRMYWSEAVDGRILTKPITSGANATLFTFPAGTSPSAIHYDTGVLYFATFTGNNGSGIVYYGSPDGGGGAQPLASNQKYPYAIATDTQYVYWTTEGDFPADGGAASGGGVFRCAKSGCGGNPQQLASNLTDARGIVVDDTAIYFTTYGSGNNDGAVWRLAKP